jgi:hypothetical protein
VDTYLYDAEGRIKSEAQQVPELAPVVGLTTSFATGNRRQLAAAIGVTVGPGTSLIFTKPEMSPVMCSIKLEQVSDVLKRYSLVEGTTLTIGP